MEMSKRMYEQARGRATLIPSQDNKTQALLLPQTIAMRNVGFIPTEPTQ